MNTADLLERGFDPVFHGQACFRALLTATARPGTPIGLPQVSLEIPEPRHRSACLLLLALLDLEVSFHALGRGAATLSEYLAANTGARLLPLESADFVLVLEPDSGGRVAHAKRGCLAAPHEGATLVYAPTSLHETDGPGGVVLRLEGPGIGAPRRLGIGGLAGDEIDRWRALTDFPTGVDVWLAAADGRVAVIPRSTRWSREV
jgi:alpha-D-ribose 1-methylphosphonate 5-triphosphate synthase subunit PhnH